MIISKLWLFGAITTNALGVFGMALPPINLNNHTLTTRDATIQPRDATGLLKRIISAAITTYKSAGDTGTNNPIKIVKQLALDVEKVTHQLNKINARLDSLDANSKLQPSNEAFTTIQVYWDRLHTLAVADPFDGKAYEQGMGSLASAIGNLADGVYKPSLTIYNDFVKGQGDVNGEPLLRTAWTVFLSQYRDAILVYLDMKAFSNKYQAGLRMSAALLELAADIQEAQIQKGDKEIPLSNPASLRSHAATINGHITDWDRLLEFDEWDPVLPKEFTSFVWTVLANWNGSPHQASWTKTTWSTAKGYGAPIRAGCCDCMAGHRRNWLIYESGWGGTGFQFIRYPEALYVIHTEATGCMPFGDMYAVAQDDPLQGDIQFEANGKLADRPANFVIIPCKATRGRRFTMRLHQIGRAEHTKFGTWGVYADPDVTPRFSRYGELPWEHRPLLLKGENEFSNPADFSMESDRD